MKLSVVLPNYNHADKLPRAIHALLRQELTPDEIVVVDDASADDSVAVIQSLQREHPSIKLIRHETNRGAPAALNTGLNAAQGEYVYFGAADDFVLAGFFRRAYSAVVERPIMRCTMSFIVTSFTGLVSTFLPSTMTVTLSQTSKISPRLWEM